MRWDCETSHKPEMIEIRFCTNHWCLVDMRQETPHSLKLGPALHWPEPLSQETFRDHVLPVSCCAKGLITLFMLGALTILRTMAVLSPSGEDREGEGVHPSQQTGEGPLAFPGQGPCFCFLLCVCVKLLFFGFSGSGGSA